MLTIILYRRGLIDCHVHVTAVPGVKTMSEAVRTPEEVIHYRSSYVLKGELSYLSAHNAILKSLVAEMLLRGFTTVRDTGARVSVLACSPEA